MAEEVSVRAMVRRSLITVACTVAGGLILAYVAHQHDRDTQRLARLAALERDVHTLQQRQQNVMEHLQHLQADRAVRGETLHQLDVRLARLETHEPVQDQRITAAVERLLKLLEDGTFWCRPLPP